MTSSTIVEEAPEPGILEPQSPQSGARLKVLDTSDPLRTYGVLDDDGSVVQTIPESVYPI